MKFRIKLIECKGSSIELKAQTIPQNIISHKLP